MCVCMCVYICMCIRVCMHTCTCMCAHVCVCVRVHMQVETQGLASLVLMGKKDKEAEQWAFQTWQAEASPWFHICSQALGETDIWLQIGCTFQHLRGSRLHPQGPGHSSECPGHLSLWWRPLGLRGGMEGGLLSRCCKSVLFSGQTLPSHRRGVGACI